MTRSHPAHPDQPDPTVDAVPGDPPVPVNIWRLPPGEADAPVGARLAARLLAEYTRPKETVYDHLPSPVLREAAQATGRGIGPPAASSRRSTAPPWPWPAGRWLTGGSTR